MKLKLSILQNNPNFNNRKSGSSCPVSSMSESSLVYIRSQQFMYNKER